MKNEKKKLRSKLKNCQEKKLAILFPMISKKNDFYIV